MSDTQTREAIVTEIRDRLAAMDSKLAEATNEERLMALINQQFGALLKDPEFARKMRFAAPGDARLVGGKFARWGLNQADIEFLYDLQNALHGTPKRGGGVYQGPSQELENTFRGLSDAYYLSADEVRAIDKRAIDDLFPRITKHNVRDYERAMRAMDTAESGYGSQLIGAQYVGDLWQAARNDMRVANLIGSFEMTAPTAYLPVEVDFPAMLYVSQSTDADSSNYTTSKTGSQRVTVSADKFVIHQMWSQEMEEDSIISFVPFLRGQAQKSIAYYMDSLCLNGDETGTNGLNGADSMLGTTTHTLAFNGIRHVALVDNTGNSASAANAPVDLSMFRGAYGRMLDATYKHDWGHPNNPEDVVHIVDPYTADAMLDLDEFKTRDKAGNDAALFTGQVARVYNHPVISSIALSKSEATGYVDETAGDNLYGQIVTFNRNGCTWGWRRRVQMETERLPASDQTRIVYSLRVGFGRFTPTGAASGMEWADEVYYINL